MQYRVFSLMMYHVSISVNWNWSCLMEWVDFEVFWGRVKKSFSATKFWYTFCMIWFTYLPYTKAVMVDSLKILRVSHCPGYILSDLYWWLSLICIDRTENFHQCHLKPKVADIVSGFRDFLDLKIDLVIQNSHTLLEWYRFQK